MIDGSSGPTGGGGTTIKSREVTRNILGSDRGGGGGGGEGNSAEDGCCGWRFARASATAAAASCTGTADSVPTFSVVTSLSATSAPDPMCVT